MRKLLPLQLVKKNPLEMQILSNEWMRLLITGHTRREPYNEWLISIIAIFALSPFRINSITCMYIVILFTAFIDILEDIVIASRAGVEFTNESMVSSIRKLYQPFDRLHNNLMNKYMNQQVLIKISLSKECTSHIRRIFNTYA